MKHSDIKKAGKILYTDINADRNREENIVNYQRLLGTEFNNYAMIRLSLNLFTGLEMLDENNDADTKGEVEDNALVEAGKLLKDSVLSGNKVTPEQLMQMLKLRDKVTNLMKILTAFTDCFEVYEYVLNRRESAVYERETEYVDIYDLSDSMYHFVFSDKDKVIVNTRIQDMIAQLPVRMTRQRFLDVVSNSLSIYKGGEKQSLRDFADTIRDAALINMPEGFDTEYPELYKIYKEFTDADYSSLSDLEFERLMAELHKGTTIIEFEVTNYMMVTEIINDALIVLMTQDMIDEKYLDDKYAVARKILDGLAGRKDIYNAAEKIDDLLPELEGSQEESFEVLSQIDSNLEELVKSYRDVYTDNKTIDSYFEILMKCDKLTSSSLFMDLDTDFTVINEAADEQFIEDVKEELCNQLTEQLKDKSKFVKRSIMAKVLSIMPVFFNSQQEIKEYFETALAGCGDDSELTACNSIINSIMSGE